MEYTVYLSGEIHTNWREEIIEGCRDLPVKFLTPETDHALSDLEGDRISGHAPDDFFRDRQSALVNAIRIRTGIKRADIVIVKFGEKYRQWNAAFDAGYAAAMGKSLIIIHPEEYNHALKEADAAANAVLRTNAQAVELLHYLCR